jgi:hypothetical protein
MKAIVVIPIIPYEALLKQCPVDSPEWLMLSNGLAEDRDSCKFVNVLCDQKQLELLYEFIARTAPEFFPVIEKVAFQSNG